MLTNLRSAVILVSLVAAGCSQGASPAAPSVAGSEASGARTERKVDVIADLPCDLDPTPCQAITGVVVIDTPTVDVTAGTTGWSWSTAAAPYLFSASMPFAASPPGRLENYFLHVKLVVQPSLAQITVQLGQVDRADVTITGAGVPAIAFVADSSCASQQRVDVRFDVNLERLGQTTVSHSHCR